MAKNNFKKWPKIILRNGQNYPSSNIRFANSSSVSTTFQCSVAADLQSDAKYYKDLQFEYNNPYSITIDSVAADSCPCWTLSP